MGRIGENGVTDVTGVTVTPWIALAAVWTVLALIALTSRETPQFEEDDF